MAVPLLFPLLLTLDSLTSPTAGYLGLFLGSSLLTVVHLCVFCCGEATSCLSSRLCSCLSRRKRKAARSLFFARLDANATANAAGPGLNSVILPPDASRPLLPPAYPAPVGAAPGPCPLVRPGLHHRQAHQPDASPHNPGLYTHYEQLEFADSPNNGSIRNASAL